MKNKLEKAQDYMDAGIKIPKELIAQMNNGERGILEGISEFQRELADSLNEYISDKSFVFSAREPEPSTGKSCTPRCRPICMCRRNSIFQDNTDNENNKGGNQRICRINHRQQLE